MLLQFGVQWQLYSLRGSPARLLVATAGRFRAWLAEGLPDGLEAHEFTLSGESYVGLPNEDDPAPMGVAWCPAPSTFTDAVAFAEALKRSSALAIDARRGTGIYWPRYSLVLSDDLSAHVDDSGVLVRFLTGGVEVSAHETSRLLAILSWLSAEQVARVLRAAGLAKDERKDKPREPDMRDPGEAQDAFSLPGREDLATFLQEHVVDIVQNAERYKRLGISFPGSILLYGPPGTGKTFAVDRLAEYLGWPRFDIASSTVGSPYIHATSTKIAGVFSDAARNAPALVVIDEMDAYLAARDDGESSPGHHVEEVSEFLRAIPQSTSQRVLVVGMTNRLDAIDPAILRRGRFDHVIEVGPASVAEIANLIRSLLRTLPRADDVDVDRLADRMDGWPLSDVTFVIREAARLTARDGRAALDAERCEAALRAVEDKRRSAGARSRIGFR